jgi:hypothetical protein
MYRYIVAHLLATAMVLGCAFPGWAQGNISFGKLQIVPGLEYQAEYNDNIFLERRNEKNDWIHTISPSLFMDWEQDDDNYARLGYRADVVRYDDYSDTDYEAHNLLGDVGYKSPQGFYFSARDRFLDTEDPYGSDNDYNLGKQTKRWNNNLVLRSGYEFSRIYRLEFSYRNRVQKYDRFVDQWQDTMSHEPGVAMYYRVMPKTSAFVEYRFETTEYTEQQDLDDNDRGADSDTAQDFDYHKAFVGLEWDASAKLNGQLKFGYGYKDYDNTFSFRRDEDGNRIKYDDASTWIAETNLTYNWRPKTAFDARILRETYDSPSSINTRYDRTQVGIGVAQALGQRMILRADAAYTLRDYDETSREDDQYELGLDLRYAMLDWLSAGVRYEYDDRESDDKDFEYTNNVFAMYLKAEY